MFRSKEDLDGLDRGRSCASPSRCKSAMSETSRKKKKKSSTLHRFLRCRNTTCSLQSCNRLLRHPLSSMKHIPLQMFCANVFPKAIMAQTRPHIQTDRCVIFRVFPFSVFCLFMFRALLFLSSLPGQQKSFVRVARDASNGPNIAKQERSEN